MSTQAMKEGSMSSRGNGNNSGRLKQSSTIAFPKNAESQNFVKLVERTTDLLVGADDTAVEEVRRILLQVRSQYDRVHYEAEMKEAHLRKVREQIQATDERYGSKARRSRCCSSSSPG